MPSQTWISSSRQSGSQWGGRVDAGIAQKLGAVTHALLEFDGECDQRGQWEFEMLETAKRKSDIECVLRFASIPALSRGDLVEQSANQSTPALCVFQPQKKIAGHRQVVAT